MFCKTLLVVGISTVVTFVPSPEQGTSYGVAHKFGLFCPIRFHYPGLICYTTFHYLGLLCLIRFHYLGLLCYTRVQ